MGYIYLQSKTSAFPKFQILCRHQDYVRRSSSPKQNLVVETSKTSSFSSSGAAHRFVTTATATITDNWSLCSTVSTSHSGHGPVDEQEDEVIILCKVEPSVMRSLLAAAAPMTLKRAENLEIRRLQMPFVSMTR